MKLITKDDLHYSDYVWHHYEDDDPKVTGTPDSTLLNRKEGYEILYLINKLDEDWDLKQKASGVKIERMIQVVPSDIRSQEKIKNWISTNWENY